MKNVDCKRAGGTFRHCHVTLHTRKENELADKLTRSSTNGDAFTVDILKHIHDALRYPGIRRMVHYERTTTSAGLCGRYQTLDCTVAGTCLSKAVTLSVSDHCSCQSNPSLGTIQHRHERACAIMHQQLIYSLLTVLDDYSRFPFCISNKKSSGSTVIKCLHSLFSVFGAPMWMPTSHAQSFMSEELQRHDRENGIGTCRTTPGNPTGEGPVERYKALVMATRLTLSSRNLDVKNQKQCWLLLCTRSGHYCRHNASWTNSKYPCRSMYGYSMQSGLAKGSDWLGNEETRPFVKVWSPCWWGGALEVSHQYTHTRYPDGLESTVSAQHLVPAGEALVDDRDSLHAPYQMMQPATEQLSDQSESDAELHSASANNITQTLDSQAQRDLDTKMPRKIQLQHSGVPRGSLEPLSQWIWDILEKLCHRH